METSKTIGRYEILEELGHGAMGTVYRAKDPSMDRIVALKTIISVALASAQGSEFRERFYREARAAGRLAHPGIVPMFDVGEHEGLPFLVMEFINGQTLAEAVKKGERLTLDRVCEIGQQVAEALGYAHQHGVVHRDIKPANILLTSREAHGIERPKITDFGVAKLAAGQITTSGQMLGTPAFMPPEQFTGAPIDGRADLFSVGVILYWMATGEQPFPGETMTAVSYKVVHTEPVPPRKLNPSIPENLDRVILKCLAKSPADRYQTGEELARDLAAMRTGNTAGLQIKAPQATLAEMESGATLDSHPTNALPLPAAAAPGKTIANAPAGKPDIRYALAAAVVLVAALGGWYLLRDKSSVKETAPTTHGISATPQPLAPAPTVPPVVTTPNGTKPAVVPAKKDERTTDAKTATIAPPKARQPELLPAPVDFDPRALNPKENARLKIDANQMPANLDFTIELNGKIYFRRSAAGNRAEYEDLFVPPGVQEFRVTAQSNGMQKASNIASTEFKAKKKKTLKIELRTQGNSANAGVPKDLYPDSQLVVTLK
jgi:eukaryotic-like serine/threonine-protein kinase